MKNVYNVNKDFSELFKELNCCKLCPHECRANRFNSDRGYCNSPVSTCIASICRHQGEEPAISGTKGICNVFFCGCNLKCIYCQNYQISYNIISSHNTESNFDKIISDIIYLLDAGCHAVGFVSPSHYIPQMKLIIEKIRKTGRDPVFVMNTNSYDKVKILAGLEGYIDIYLPDFKYMDASLAKKLSDANSYPQIASDAIKEMIRQKGTELVTNENGEARSGVIIRHLVLPGYIENSLSVLKHIASEFSTDVYLSLMSQYNPTPNVGDHKSLSRPLTKAEYDSVLDELSKLGFENGWIQDIDSAGNYNPDFNREVPFK